MEWVVVTLAFMILGLAWSMNAHLSEIARALGEIGLAIRKTKEDGDRG